MWKFAIQGLIKDNGRAKMNERYPMCKDQIAQIDCRATECRWHNSKGKCTNISPAITLNGNSWVCWTKNFVHEGNECPKCGLCNTGVCNKCD